MLLAPAGKGMPMANRVPSTLRGQSSSMMPGTGTKGYRGDDGPGSSPLPASATAIAHLQPHVVTVHPVTGDIYRAASSNYRIIVLRKTSGEN